GALIADAVGAHLHVLHLAAADAVEAVAAARASGKKITAETCPHYLTLTSDDFGRLGSAMKVYPPIRERDHQDRLWEGLTRGKIQTIGSDDGPHAAAEKDGDLWSVPAGAAMVQDTVRLLLDAAAQGRINMNRIAALMSANPARLAGIYGRKGTL